MSGELVRLQVSGWLHWQCFTIPAWVSEMALLKIYSLPSILRSKTNVVSHARTRLVIVPIVVWPFRDHITRSILCSSASIPPSLIISSVFKHLQFHLSSVACTMFSNVSLQGVYGCSAKITAHALSICAWLGAERSYKCRCPTLILHNHQYHSIGCFFVPI